MQLDVEFCRQTYACFLPAIQCVLHDLHQHVAINDDNGYRIKSKSIIIIKSIYIAQSR